VQFTFAESSTDSTFPYTQLSFLPVLTTRQLGMPVSDGSIIKASGLLIEKLFRCEGWKGLFYVGAINTAKFFINRDTFHPFSLIMLVVSCCSLAWSSSLSATSGTSPLHS
jgi:hypothetical protein